ncbi:DUF2510 domain-containing protein [Knoellia remsis]|uniref:DUF2510 domain-containing protein n=1 Tax=Knoellia remsis TaxID=407159 RepID=UPI000D085CCF
MSEQARAGWHHDPFRRFEYRYWDGRTWTDHVSTAGLASTDPPVPTATKTESQPEATPEPRRHEPVPEEPRVQEQAPHSAESQAQPVFTHSPRRDSWQPERITAFNAKRLAEKYLGVATSLEEEDARLRGLLGEMGALDAAARKEQIEQLSKDATALAQEVERERAGSSPDRWCTTVIRRGLWFRR